MSQKEENKLISEFDYFAGVALQALIMKAPFYDTGGHYGERTNADDVEMLKGRIAYSAWRYAKFMMDRRDEFINPDKHPQP